MSRAFARWDDPNADRSIYLEGEILSIDARASTSPGAIEDELRSISQLFDLHGRGLWDRIDGSYCLLVRDGRTWQIGVDVSGTRSVYWWFEHGAFAFHSHLVDLAPTHPGRGATDLGAIGNFLASGMFPPVHTAFEAIHHLGAGQCLSVSAAGVVADDYFRMAYNDGAARKSKHVMIDELIDLLSESVGSAWRVATRPVVPLSGGTDSRYIAAEIVRQARDPAQVQTITWGEDRTRIGSDAVVAEQVAAALGARNQWYEKATAAHD